jgi:hypothetical protein
VALHDHADSDQADFDPVHVADAVRITAPITF